MKLKFPYRSFCICNLYFFLILNNTKAQKGLFDSDEVINIKLKGSLQVLLNNRSSEPKYFTLLLCVYDKDSNQLEIPVQVKTRGHFRRIEENCLYPPLLIKFSNNGQQKSSIFKEQKKIKLVMPCTDDEYIIREWLVYKIYNLLTSKSFRVRLIRLSLVDELRSKTVLHFFSLLLEDEKQMAKRNKMIALEQKLKPQQLQYDEFLLMAIFQYLIGNTDWSVQYLQNIKLIAENAMLSPIAVPYDFDQAGIVDAPYAKPAEELKMSSTRDRRYRGYCPQDLHSFITVLEKFKNKKGDIYDLYSGCTLLPSRYKKSTIHFLDKFYETINNDKKWQKAFAYPCDKKGTGNVVIKGLKVDN